MSPQALAEKPSSAEKPAAEARRYKNFINGQWVESSSGKSIPNINPANTDDVIGTVKQATREEAKRAVESAAESFPGWRATPAPSRGKIVARAALLLEEHK